MSNAFDERTDASLLPSAALDDFAEYRRQGGRVLTYPVPVSIGVDVTIEGEFPLTDAQWNQFIAVLTAMKPGLVQTPDAKQAPPEPDA